MPMYARGAVHDLPAAPLEARATSLFTLTEDAGLVFRDGRINSQVGHGQIRDFCAGYHALAIERELALDQYLRESPRQFRVWLESPSSDPSTPELPETLGQLCWYSDELLLPDDLWSMSEFGLTSDTRQLPKDAQRFIQNRVRQQVIRWLRVLQPLRAALERGSMLLARDPLGPRLIETDTTNFNVIYNRGGSESIVLWDDQQERMWETPVDDLEVNALEEVLRRARISEHESSIEKFLGDMGLFEATHVQVLDVRTGERSTKRLSAARFLLHNARSREASILVASPANLVTGSSRPAREFALSLQVPLPYLQGVPLESLLDLREREWDSFREFRTAIGKYVHLHDSYESGLQSVINAARAQVENELRPAARRIEREMSGLLRRAGLKGLVAGAIAMGALHGVSIELGLLGAAATTLATATGEYMVDSRRQKGTAAYFLWQVDQRKQRRRSRV
jgi:hypothetical protein